MSDRTRRKVSPESSSSIVQAWSLQTTAVAPNSPTARRKNSPASPMAKSSSGWGTQSAAAASRRNASRRAGPE